MKKAILLLLLVSSSIFSLGGCQKGVPLYQPDFEVQAKSTAAVRNTIKNVLKRRRWIIKSSGSNYFVARYDHGARFSATVRIDFTSRKVKIKRLNSFGLNYENSEDGELIHKRFNKYMNILEQDIERELSYL